MTRSDDKWMLRAWLLGLAMAAFFAVYGFMSIAAACPPAGLWKPPGHVPPPPSAAQLARDALRDGRIVQAITLFAQAGETEWVARLRFQLAEEATQKRDLRAAERELRAALAANPRHIGAVAALVETLRALGRHDAGLGFVAAQKAPMQAEPLVVAAKAKILYDLGDVLGARTLLAGLANKNQLPTALGALWKKLGVELVSPRNLGM